MADYFPLLSKAVAALDPNTSDARQALYERARSALLRQFAAMSPVVEQAVVDRELKSLDVVIARIEDSLRPSPPAPDPIEPQINSVPDTSSDLELKPLPIERPKMEALADPSLRKTRRPMMAVLLTLGIMALIATAVVAFLRRDIPAQVADRAAPAPVVATATPAQKAPDRIGDASSPSTPSSPAPSSPAPSSPAPSSSAPSSSAPSSPAPSSPAPIAAAPPPPAPIAPPVPAPVPTPAPAPVAPAPPPVAVAPPPAVVAPAPVPAPVAPPPAASIGVANRAVLLLQGEGQDPRSSIVSRQGQVVWRAEPVVGQPGEMALRADIDIAPSKLQLEFTIQRNRDASLPASHLVQLRFLPGAGSEVSTVQSIATVEFRQIENQPGYQLAGQGIPVVANLFLIALSQVEQTRQLNVQMMQSRPLIYLEFALSDGKRGAILFEKGVSGEQLFAEAFRRW